MREQLLSLTEQADIFGKGKHHQRMRLLGYLTRAS